MATVTELIALAAERRAADEQEERLRVQMMLDAAQQDFRSVFGEAFDELLPFAKGVYEQERAYVYVKWEVRAEALELVPFSVHWFSNRHGGSRIELRLNGKIIDGAKENSVADLLHQAHEDYPAWKEKQVGDLVKYLVDRLSFPHGPNQPDAETAQKVFDDLMRLRPEQHESWSELYERWTRIRARIAANERERAEHEEKVRQAEAEYLAAYEQWRGDYQALLQANRQKVDDLQARLDEPFEVYELRYAVFVLDDGVEQGVEVGTVYVAEPEPDEDGFWMRYSSGSVGPMKFFKPISLEGPLVVQPTDGVSAYAHRSIVTQAQKGIWYADGVDIEQAIRELDLTPLPVSPDEPELLAGSNVARSIRQRVMRGLADIADIDDIPF